MRIVIFGTGGVGGAFGGHLAHSGADVTFIARGEHLKAMQAYGLKVESAEGNFVVTPVKATDDPRSIKNADVILLCIKTWQLEQVIDDLKAMIGPDTFVVPLLNSIEATDKLVSALGAAHVLGGYCYTVSYIVAPGIVHSGGKQQIVFGELDHSPSARAEKLAAIINATNVLKAESSTDIHVRMWEKFTWIASASAMGAVVRVQAGDWRELEPVRKLFETLLREAFAVAMARGVSLSDKAFDDNSRYIDVLAASFRSSMQRDIEAGKRSELMQQIGYIVREGTRLGVAVPISSAFYAALLPQELMAHRAK